MPGYGSPSVSIDEVPQPARTAWLRLRDELQVILGDDVIAIWAHGGTTFTSDPPRSGDLDTYVILRSVDQRAAQRTADAQDAIARDLGVEWDTWYVLAGDALRPDAPQHAFQEERRDTAWAVNRAHWLAGRYVQLYGLEPAELVPVPTWAELEADMSRELEHIERHVLEGDTDPYEATYALFNGSRILHSLETRDVAISKRAAGTWALEHLPDRWHPALRAAMRAYAGEATAEDEALIAAEMPPFVAMVRERLPYTGEPTPEPRPRWSGY
ncbi:MAG TPA: aminoglycoside adenylyltransferase domain-containing protein [Candidatus Limnocylindria bacterium]|nr:aminoglycoside adenylyltransferase domain-containing protein [Candidatus Limnocylindria bacterium]